MQEIKNYSNLAPLINEFKSVINTKLSDMRKKFLPISLLLTIIILAQTNFVVNANGGSGKYIPRTSGQATAQSFMKSIRANQETGLIDPAWLVSSKKSQSRNAESLNWTSLGPDNYGSLTRGIVYDKNDATNKTIYIGTMGGGVFQSVNGGITWKAISNNMMISCITQTEDGSIYVGTGDGRGSHDVNGLSVLNYATSFVGSGVYKLGSEEPISGTEELEFVNDIASFGNIIYIASNKGLYRYENNALTALVEETEVYGVEACPNGAVLAVVGNDVYFFNGEGEEYEILTSGEEGKLPKGETYKIIAVSPSDHNYMYVSYLSKTNGTGNIYFTSDHGKTWQIAYTATAMYDIYGTRGLFDNAMVVYPNNPKKVLIGGLNLWVMRDEFGEGIFRVECISDGNGTQISQSGGTFFYNYKYVHSGIQSIAFSPSNANEFFVGTEGGVFKGSFSNNTYLYEGANRYFETAENHTSVARMFNVAMAGEESRVLGGSLDHGTIHVLGQKDLNNESTGSAIFPNDVATTDAAATYGAFDFTKAGGPCAISTINDRVVFVTTTGSFSVGTPLFRSERNGEDYDKENFTYSATEQSSPEGGSGLFLENRNAFRTPIALFENYNDQYSKDIINYIAKEDLKANETITVHSENGNHPDVGGGYPFEYTLKQDVAAGDTIEVYDIISSTFLVAVEGKVVMTREALKINKKVDWWTIANIAGIPSALTISSDGDLAYVGTVSGKLYRIEGISKAVTKELATDSLKTIVSTEIDSKVFNGQAITSVAINPNNHKNIIVTLGNYGNENYVFVSNDGSSFSPVQNLPKVPAYSSLIENTSGLVMIGTEIGLFTSSDMTSWQADETIKDVPVMEIKQQLLRDHDVKYINLVDEVGDVTTYGYAGISNQDIIYIATYGKGLFRCNNFRTKDGESIIENTSSAKSLEMSIYPNPIVSEATISFNVEETARVSYQIYDLSGRMVQNATLGTYGQGSHTANFNVNGLSAGTYIVKVQAGTVSNVSKILVH